MALDEGIVRAVWMSGPKSRQRRTPPQPAAAALPRRLPGRQALPLDSIYTDESVLQPPA
jgi:hypothetical protein